MDKRDLDLLFPEWAMLEYSRRLISLAGSALDPVSAVRIRPDTVILACFTLPRPVRVVAPLVGFSEGEIAFRSILKVAPHARAFPIRDNTGSGEFEKIADFGTDGPRLVASASAVEAWIRSEKREDWQDEGCFAATVDGKVKAALASRTYADAFQIVHRDTATAILEDPSPSGTIAPAMAA